MKPHVAPAAQRHQIPPCVVHGVHVDVMDVQRLRFRAHDAHPAVPLDDARLRIPEAPCAVLVLTRQIRAIAPARIPLPHHLRRMPVVLACPAAEPTRRTHGLRPEADVARLALPLRPLLRRRVLSRLRGRLFARTPAEWRPAPRPRREPLKLDAARLALGAQLPGCCIHRPLLACVAAIDRDQPLLVRLLHLEGIPLQAQPAPVARADHRRKEDAPRRILFGCRSDDLPYSRPHLHWQFALDRDLPPHSEPRP